MDFKCDELILGKKDADSRALTFGGMDASLMARLKELEEENRRLKKMYAEERLKAEIISEAMAKKW